LCVCVIVCVYVYIYVCMYVCIYIYMYMQATYLTAGAATAYGVGVLSPDPASHAMFASSQKSAYSRSLLPL
jgi:hypothetical protein